MAEARRASRLRRRLVEGRQVAESERAWLAEYDLRVGGAGRPRTLLPAPSSQPAATGAPAGSPEPSEPSSDSDQASPAAAAAAELPPVDFGAPAEPAGSDPAGAVTGEILPLNWKDIAGGYCSYLKEAGAELRAAGWPALPDPLIDAMVYPAACRVAQRATKWLAKNSNMNSEDFDLALTVGPGVEVAAFKLLGGGARTSPRVEQPEQPPSQPSPSQQPASPPEQRAPTGGQRYAIG